VNPPLVGSKTPIVARGREQSGPASTSAASPPVSPTDISVAASVLGGVSVGDGSLPTHATR